MMLSPNICRANILGKAVDGLCMSPEERVRTNG